VPVRPASLVLVLSAQYHFLPTSAIIRLVVRNHLRAGIIRRFGMQVIHRLLATLRRDEEGQGLAEYALILALIAIVAIIALIFLGNQVSTILSTVGSSI
jgi:pilus assembly protein Flp/PilA